MVISVFTGRHIYMGF